MGHGMAAVVRHLQQQCQQQLQLLVQLADQLVVLATCWHWTPWSLLRLWSFVVTGAVTACVPIGLAATCKTAICDSELYTYLFEKGERTWQ
jgi:hypothetical protein